MFPVPARKKWHCLPGRVRYTKAQPVVTDVHVRSLVSNTVVPIPGAWWYGYSLLFFFSSLAWGLIFVVVNFSLASKIETEHPKCQRVCTVVWFILSVIEVIYKYKSFLL